jgi:hypothetical protein
MKNAGIAQLRVGAAVANGRRLPVVQPLTSNLRWTDPTDIRILP